MYIAPVAIKTGLDKPNGHKTRIPKAKLIQLQTISLLGNKADLINLKKKKVTFLFCLSFICRLCENIICKYNTLKAKKKASFIGNI